VPVPALPADERVRQDLGDLRALQSFDWMPLISGLDGLVAASTYPGTLDAFATNKQDDTDATSGSDLGLSTTVGDHATHHNNLADAINKIEAELGVNPRGTFADVVTRLNARTTVRKTADQSFTTQTLANVTDLSFSVLANTDYTFQFVLAFTVGVARGIGLGLTAPAGRVVADVQIGGIAADGTAAATQGVINTSGDVVISAAAAATTESIAIIHGILRPTANGTLQLQARQGSGGTAVNAVVKQSSWGELVVS